MSKRDAADLDAWLKASKARLAGSLDRLEASRARIEASERRVKAGEDLLRRAPRSWPTKF